MGPFLENSTTHTAISITVYAYLVCTCLETVAEYSSFKDPKLNTLEMRSLKLAPVCIMKNYIRIPMYILSKT